MSSATPSQPPEPVDSGRLSESVYERILGEILAGKLRPGQAIGEQALARRLGISRTPVHDAIRRLIGDGIMTQQANRRPVVATVTADDLAEIFDMRALLEGEAAARAASRIDRGSLRSLRDQAEAAGAALDAAEDGWLDAWTDHDDGFHARIATASGNRRLASDIARYRLLHRALNLQHTSADDLRNACEEHLRLLDALAIRDAIAARSLMIEHIFEWKAFFVQRLFETDRIGPAIPLRPATQEPK